MQNFPTRKRIRLEGYDYSQAGCYFITICVKDRREILAHIVGDAALGVPQASPQEPAHIVGDAHPGVPPASPQEPAHIVGDAHPGVPPASPIEQSKTGAMVAQYIESIAENYAGIQVDKYVVMPNHIHLLLRIECGTPGCASPTKQVLAKVINAFKSLTSRQYGTSLWQRAYHDHIVRDEHEYQTIWQYIDENPAKWPEDRYFTKNAPFPSQIR